MRASENLSSDNLSETLGVTVRSPNTTLGSNGTGDKNSNNDNQSEANMSSGSAVFIGTVIGGVIALFGSIIGTYLPHYLSGKREAEEEARFNRSIRMVVKTELENSLRFINSFKEDELLSQEESNTLVALPREYMHLSLEKRALTFTPETLSKIEQTYNFLDIYVSTLKGMFVSKSTKVTFRDFANKVGLETLKKSLREAIDAINKEEESEHKSES